MRAITPCAIDRWFLRVAVAALVITPSLGAQTNAVTLVIPPLRERTDEIEPLARHFLTTISSQLGRPAPTLARVCSTSTWGRSRSTSSAA